MTKEERERGIERVVDLLPSQPDDPKAVIRLMEERELLEGHVIVYKADFYTNPLTGQPEKACFCRCSACGEKWYSLRITTSAGCWKGASHIGFYNHYMQTQVCSGDKTCCPQCGADVTARHVSAFGSSNRTYIDSDHCVTVHEVNGHLAVLDWYAERMVDKAGDIQTFLYGYEGAVVIDGTWYRISGHTKNIGGRDCWHKWQRRKGRIYDFSAVCKISQMIPFADELVARTDADKSGFEDYCRNLREKDGFLPCSYLQLWCRFPQAENLVRTGNARFVNGLIVASQCNTFSYYTRYKYFVPNNTKRYADWKKVKPHEILHLDKDEYRMLTGKPFETFNYYQSIKDDYGIRLTPELLKKAEAIGVMKCREITKDKTHYGREVSPVRVINYLYRQKLAVVGTARSFYPSDLLDHWRMLHEYYKELPVSIMFPADFFVHHERISRLIAERDDRELSEKIARVTEQARRFAWEDAETGLLITPARCAEDLKEEGKALVHCVAGYARLVSRGETTIFFIRRIEEPDKPFFTLEYRNDRVIQNRGYKNCERTEQVRKFEERWLAHIDELKKADAKAAKKAKKEKKQNGKSDADGKRGSAAA